MRIGAAHILLGQCSAGNAAFVSTGNAHSKWSVHKAAARCIRVVAYYSRAAGFTTVAQHTAAYRLVK